MNPTLNTGLVLFSAMLVGLAMINLDAFKAHIRTIWSIDSRLSMSEQVWLNVLIMVIVVYVSRL